MGKRACCSCAWATSAAGAHPSQTAAAMGDRAVRLEPRSSSRFNIMIFKTRHLLRDEVRDLPLWLRSGELGSLTGTAPLPAAEDKSETSNVLQEVAHLRKASLKNVAAVISRMMTGRPSWARAALQSLINVSCAHVSAHHLALAAVSRFVPAVPRRSRCSSGWLRKRASRINSSSTPAAREGIARTGKCRR